MKVFVHLINFELQETFTIFLSHFQGFNGRHDMSMFSENIFAKTNRA